MLTNEAAEQDIINDFEIAVLHRGDIGVARGALRRYLFGIASQPVEGSVAHAIAAVAALSHPPKAAAAIVLRALPIPEIVRENTGNQVNRHIVDLSLKALPELCSILGVQSKMQTYEKFELIRGAFDWVKNQLHPLVVPYTTIESLLSAKRPILSAIGHGRLLDFGRVYHAAEVKDAVDAILAKLAQVSKTESTLAADVETCERVIADARRLSSEYPSFLTVEFLQVFLNNAGKCLTSFLESQRGRFRSALEKGWTGTDLPKRYPLSERNRDLRIVLPLINHGPGAAVDLKVSVTSDSEQVLFENDNVEIGTISAGPFSIGLDAHIVDPCDQIELIIDISWSEVGTTKRESACFEVRILAQSSTVDWDKHTYADPYGTAPAEGEDFVGRQEQVQTIVGRTLRRPPEPSYITGQKRVGKTSLAKTAAAQAQKLDPQAKLSWTYILWGQISHENPRVALRQLGEEIEEFIVSQLPSGVALKAGNYDGSLSGLVRLANSARQIDPERRFVVIIDEFDEMPQELYLQGNLAETLFGNIRAITTTSNLCLLLVGGENMPFVMDRQGQKLNKFSRVNLTYFLRDLEWDDFAALVKEPAKDLLEWHADAVGEIYELSNGNPYFAKIICSKVFTRAIRERDAVVTRDEVRQVVDSEISRLDDNLFAHLWQDGIFLPVDEREPIVLKRKRVLAAIARCLRANVELTLSNIYAARGTADLGEGELTSVLNDFENRQVLSEEQGVFRLVLPIFALWLADVGLSRLASDTLSEELANEAQRKDDEARVLSEELVELARKWPTYRGRHIGAEDVRAWLNQVPGNRDQRLLFQILRSAKFLSESDILERIRNARLVTIGLVEPAVRRKATERRSDVVITYVDGEGKSGQRYASLFAEENLISTKSILSPENFSEKFEEYVAHHGAVKAIVIVDDFVGTGRSLAANVKKLHDDHLVNLQGEKPSVLVFSLLATVDGQQTLLDALGALSYADIDFRAGEVLGIDAFAFAEESGVFTTTDDKDRAKALCTDIGATIYKRAPLGYANQGVLVILPTTVPNNSLPILHSHGKGSAPQWRPLFPRLVN